MSTPADWQSLPLRLSSKTFTELLDGGQAFRWNITERETWRGLWSNHVVEIQIRSESNHLWRPLTSHTQASDLSSYLGDDLSNEKLIDRLPWRSDPILESAINAFRGLRILNQPLGETLLCFLCSSNKQIVQIKAMLEAIAQFGEPLIANCKALPTWKTLAQIPESELRACKLGYRARYIAETARYLANQEDWESELKTLPYAEAHTWLCTLSGVGPKVADCVLLFGAAKLEAFPIDTWIERVLHDQYGLQGWSQRQLQTFAGIHFGQYAGLAQQYLFAAAKVFGRKAK